MNSGVNGGDREGITRMKIGGRSGWRSALNRHDNSNNKPPIELKEARAWLSEHSFLEIVLMNDMTRR